MNLEDRIMEEEARVITIRHMPLPYSTYVRNIEKEYETCRN